MLVASLIQATARVLNQDGYEALSTNRVAREAGVSVGSLYQYFPDKEALVHALTARWIEQAEALVAELRGRMEVVPVSEGITLLVRLALDLTRKEAPMHRALFVQLLAMAELRRFEAFHRRLVDVLADWIALRRGELAVDDPTLTAHVIVTSLDALTDHALLFRPELLDSPRFELELRRLVSGCLGAPLPASPRPTPAGALRRRYRARIGEPGTLVPLP